MEHSLRLGRWLLLKGLTAFTFVLAILFIFIALKDSCSLKLSAADLLQPDYQGRCPLTPATV